MPRKSAGLVVYHYFDKVLKVLLVHPGGPFFINRDLGVWSIPKGEYEENEDPLAVAKREFNEETGNVINSNHFVELTPVKIKSGKLISAWAVPGYFEQPFISSNLFSMEWPYKSGKWQRFAETDDAAYFTIEKAKQKINAGQIPLLEALVETLKHL